MRKQPKLVTEQDLTKFRTRTQIVVGLWLFIGFIVGEGFGAFVAGVLLLWYIYNRDRQYKLLKAAYELGIIQKVQQDVANVVETLADLKNRTVAWGANYGMIGQPFLCRTCQQAYPSTTHENVKLCWNLRDVFPHDPHDEPPNPNPYSWYWLKINGYALPPESWPTNKYWMPRTAGEADCVTAMKAEGEKYYRNHPNPLWDRGMGSPPRWYFETA